MADFIDDKWQQKIISIDIQILKQKRHGKFVNQYALYTGQFITKLIKTWRVKVEVYSETTCHWSFNFSSWLLWYFIVLIFKGESLFSGYMPCLE